MSQEPPEGEEPEETIANAGEEPSEDSPEGADEESAGETPEAESTASAEQSSADEDAADQDEASEDRAGDSNGVTPSAVEHPPLSWRARGIAIGAMVLGFGATFLMMANNGRIPHGPGIGILTTLVGVFGLLKLLNLRVDEEALPVLAAKPGEPGFMSPKVMFPLAIGLLIAGFVTGLGTLPYFIVAAFICFALSGWRRPGVALFSIVGLLYLPLLGTYALWDPWETHYGEVAREILARDDWLSLWWCQDGWFFSKPILIFWSEALTMGAMGTDYLPDANPLHPEWSIRLPIAIMAMGAVAGIYNAVSRVFTKRAGFVAGLVLATMPHFFFLAHQSITDMPFVSNMTMAMSCLLLAITRDPEAEVQTYRLGFLRFTGQHVIIGAVCMIVVPVSFYLISRNITLFWPNGFAPHGDEFWSGSAGNWEVPGNDPGRVNRPFVTGFQPFLQGLLWLSGLAAIVFWLRRDRRVQCVLMGGFYFFCAFAFMGKGIPGFALPGLVALLFLIVSKRWDMLLAGHLRVGLGILMVPVVGLPWFISMFMRHGYSFTDRLLIHDHINRLAAGVHGDNGTIEYFLEQLGFATFPWVAIIPAAMLAFIWTRTDKSASLDAQARARRDAILLLTLWFFGAFTLFSAMITKFHHYIFPTVPPAATLVGIVIHRWLGDEEEDPRRIIAIACGVLVTIIGITALYGDLLGVIPNPRELTSSERSLWSSSQAWSPFLAKAVILGGIGALALAGRNWLFPNGIPQRETSPMAFAAFIGALIAFALGMVWSTGIWVGVALLACAAAASMRSPDSPTKVQTAVALAAGLAAVSFVGRDLAWVTSSRPQGYERLINLYIYKYDRPWPEQFDFQAALTAFAIVASMLVALAIFRAARPLALRALLATAVFFCAWTLDVYMYNLSPHWGQRVLLKRYYAERTGPEQPVLAYQMNWKGENFYSGNRVNVFVSVSKNKIKDFADENAGKKIFILLERGRMRSLQSNLGSGREVVEVTDDFDCNKFMLVSVQL